MNKLVRGLVVVSAVAGVMSSAFAETKFAAADNSRLTQLCLSAATDTKVRFHANMKNTGLSRQHIASNVTCNDMSIADFAKYAGNKDNYNQLNRFPSTRVDIYQGAEQSDDGEDRVILVAGR